MFGRGYRVRSVEKVVVSLNSGHVKIVYVKNVLVAVIAALNQHKKNKNNR